MKRIIIVFLALVVVVPLVAQEDESNEGFLSRYQFDIELSYLKGPGNKDYHSNYFDYLYKFNVINGFKIASYFSIGIGTGLWYNPDPYDNYYWIADRFLFPLYLDSRLTIPNKRFSPYLSFDAGFVLNGNARYSNFLNMILDPSIGLCFKITDKLLVNVGFSYHPLHAYSALDY